MTIKEFQQKARDGGYHDAKHHMSIDELFLNSKVWQAVGESEGWDKQQPEGYWNVCKDRRRYGVAGITCLDKWENVMHDMVDFLASEGTLEEFIATL